MAYVNSYLTSDDLVDSIKLRMMLPISQNTFTYNDILKIANEEMLINAVPQIKEAHEEYFVFRVIVPLVSGISRYEIPYRALGMTLRDLFFSDENGNYVKMVRVAPEDKAFYQNNYSNNQNTNTYYLEGNQVVLTSQLTDAPTGNLNFFIYLRPNFLVRNTRAAFIESFCKTIAVNGVGAEGDTVTITTGVQTTTPTTYEFTAVTGSPATDYEFQIGATPVQTATNLCTAINSIGISGYTVTIETTNIDILYEQISDSFEVSNESDFFIDNDNVCIKFDQLETVWTDPDTEETSSLYVQNGLVDFLQTGGGHSTYNYDVDLVEIISGGYGKFPVEQLQGFLGNNSGGDLQYLPIKIGDYICPQNECIIPQIPDELHYALAERSAAFILQAMGDQEGLTRSQQRIQQMNEAQSKIIDSRVTGSVPKVFNPNNLLRMGKAYRRWRY